MLDGWPALAWFYAPAGYGKTTAVAAWLREQEQDDLLVLWVDVLDGADTQQLWTQVAQRCGLEVSSGDDPLELVRHHVAGHRGRVVLVLDDLDRIEDRQVVEDLGRLIQRHDHLHALICTRRPLDLTPVSTRVDVKVLALRDLALTRSESLSLFDMHGVTETEETLDPFLDLTEGHPQVVHWAACFLVEELAVPRRPLVEATRRASDRLVQTGLSNLSRDLDAEEWEFAVRSSRVAQLDDESAELIMPGRGADMLAALLAAGVSVLEASRHGDRHRLLALYRKGLRECPSTWVVDEQQVILRELAERARRAEDWVAAFTQAIELTSTDLLADLLEQHWLLLLAEPLLARALEALPEDLYAARPRLADARETYRVFSQPGRMNRESQVPLWEPGESSSESMADRCMDQLVLMIGLRSTGRMLESADLGRRMAPLLETLQSTHPGEAAFTWLHSGISHQLTAEWTDALEFVNHAYALREHDQLGFLARNCEGAAAHLSALQGETREAHRWLELADLHTPADTWMERRIATSAALAHLWLAMEALDPVATEAPLRQVTLQLSDDELWPYIIETQVMHALLWGDPESMLEEVLGARRVYSSRAGPGTYAELVLARSALDLRVALGHGGAAEAELARLPEHHPWAVTRRARLRLLAGRHDEVLAEALPVGNRLIRDRLDLALVQAVASAELGLEAQARDFARRAELLLRPNPLMTSLAALSDRHQQMLFELSPEVSAVVEPYRDRLPATCRDELDMVSLSEREALVLRHLAGGRGREEIADQLFVSVNTVKTQLSSVYRKLEVKSGSQALNRARDLGLLS